MKYFCCGWYLFRQIMCIGIWEIVDLWYNVLLYFYMNFKLDVVWLKKKIYFMQKFEGG